MKFIGYNVRESNIPGGTNYAYSGSWITGAANSLQEQINNLSTAGNPNALYIIGPGCVNNQINNGAGAYTAAQAITDFKAALNTLQQKGAKYIVIANSPNPRLAPNPTITAFNESLKTANAKFVTIDYAGATDWLVGNFGKLGFANFTNLLDVALAPAWHTTAAGAKALSDYYLSVINSAAFSATLAEMPTTLLNNHNDAVLGQLTNAKALNLTNSRVRAFAYGNYLPRVGSPVNSNRATNKYQGHNATLGFIAPVDDNTSLGIALAHAKGETKLKQAMGEFRLASNTVSIFADTNFAKANLSAVASYGKLDFGNIERNVSLTGNNKIFTMRARSQTEGEQFGATLQGKYHVFTDTNYESGPLARVAYNRTKIKGYTETGAEFANMRFDQQHYKTLNIGLGWHAKYSFANAVLANAKVLVNKQMLKNKRDINLQVVSSGNQSFGVLPVTGTKSTSMAADFSLQKEFGSIAASIGYGFAVGEHKDIKHALKLGLLL